MNIPELKDVIIKKIEEVGERTAIYVTLPRKPHPCPTCGRTTEKIPDYRMQKVNHLKWFERLTVFFYKRLRSECDCEKRSSSFVDKYQRVTKEWSQEVQIRPIKD